MCCSTHFDTVDGVILKTIGSSDSCFPFCGMTFKSRQKSDTNELFLFFLTYQSDQQRSIYTC
jgi:hypothetical protein